MSGKKKREEDKRPQQGIIAFRIPIAKKAFLEKSYGKDLSGLMRDHADVLIARSLNWENK